MHLVRSLSIALLATSMFACDAEEEEEHQGPPTLIVEADVTEVMPGETITLTFEVENFSFSGEEGDHDHEHEHEGLARQFDPKLVAAGEAIGAEGDHDHEGGDYDGPRVGHVHVYLDDLMTNPLAMITKSTGEVVIDTTAGSHTLISRLHSADHRIIEPQVIDEIEISVLTP